VVVGRDQVEGVVASEGRNRPQGFTGVPTTRAAEDDASPVSPGCFTIWLAVVGLAKRVDKEPHAWGLRCHVSRARNEDTPLKIGLAREIGRDIHHAQLMDKFAREPRKRRPGDCAAICCSHRVRQCSAVQGTWRRFERARPGQ
jgi:hypothetical protein